MQVKKIKTEFKKGGEKVITLLGEGGEKLIEWNIAAFQWVADTIDDAVDSLTGRTDPPDPCHRTLTRGGEDLARLDGNLVAVHECLEHRDGDVGVKVKSNRRYIQLVTTPASADGVKVDLLGSWSDDLAGLVGKIETMRPNSYVLYGGVGMSYRLSGSVAGAFPVHAYPTYSLDVLSVVIRALLANFEELLADAFGPLNVEIGKCIVEKKDDDAPAWAQSAMVCIGKNLTIEALKKKLAPATYGKVKRVLGNKLAASAKKLSSWGKVAFEAFDKLLLPAYDAVKDRRDLGEKTITITPTAKTESPTTTTTTTRPVSSSESTPPRLAYCVAGDLRWRSDRGLWVVEADGTNRKRLSFDSAWPQWSPDGTLIAYLGDYPAPFANPEFGLWVVEASSGNRRKITSEAAWMAWSPDNTRILYEVNEPGLWVENTDGTNPIKISNDSGHFEGWSPDGSRITYSRVSSDGFARELWVADTDRINPTKIADNGSFLTRDPGAGGWSPAGTHFSYTAYPPDPEVDSRSTIWVRDADGTNPTRIITGDAPYLLWSPDGSRIAYGLFSFDGGLWVANADGTNPTKISNGTGLIKGWSPDGTRIAYSSSEGLWVANADGTNPTMINDRILRFWGWSPDGTRIAYSVSDGLWVANADGTNQKRIDTQGNNAQWSPDGTRILYEVNKQRLWVANADGTNQKKLTPDAVGEVLCSVWSPTNAKSKGSS